MKRLLLGLGLALALVLACGTASAVRTVELIEGAYEIALSGVTFPSSVGGFVRVKTCDQCEAVDLRVVSASRFFTSAGEITFAEFLLAVDQAEEADGAYLLVLYDLESKQVTRVGLRTIGA